MTAERALLLTYHHVADAPTNAAHLAVSPEHFAAHLEILAREARPLTLAALAERLLVGEIPPRAVVVTLDDGYLDNLGVAKPLLERFGIPATIFVTGDGSADRAPFWWDELEALLLHPGTLPPRLELSLEGGAFRWELGESARYEESDWRRHRGWKAWEEPPTPRHGLFVALREALAAKRAPRPHAVIENLRAWGGSRETPHHRRLSDADVVRLAESPLVEIGAHTATHPFLSRLPAATQAREVEANRLHLEAILARPVRSFAYPHGDYSSETVGIVREMGFACACTAETGPVRSDADLFRLPRLHVDDRDAAGFAEMLRRAWDT